METITYVISPGANLLEIPMLAFPTPEQARAHLHRLGFVPSVTASLGMVTHRGWVRNGRGGLEQVQSTREEFATVPDLSDGAYLTADHFSFVRVPVGHPCQPFTDPRTGESVPGVTTFETVMDFADNSDSDPRVEEIIRALCAGGHYYGGCGGMYRLEIRTAPIGTPVVAWDLD